MFFGRALDEMGQNANIWPKMTKNAYFGPNLAVFGAKILICMGVSKSFITHIMEKLGGEQRRNQEFRFRFRQCRYRNFWQEKTGKFVNLWIDFREDIFPVYFYSESESYSLKSIQRITNSLAFSCQKFRYRHCRNRNRNSWLLLCSPPTQHIPEYVFNSISNA